jgi:HEAT repeat protein
MLSNLHQKRKGSDEDESIRVFSVLPVMMVSMTRSMAIAVFLGVLGAGCGAPAGQAQPVGPAGPAVEVAGPLVFACKKAGKNKAAPCPETDGPGPLIDLLGHPLTAVRDGAERCLKEAEDPLTATLLAEALVDGEEPSGILLLTVLGWKDEMDRVDEPFLEATAAAALEAASGDPGVIASLIGVIDRTTGPSLHVDMGVEFAARWALSKADANAVGPLMDVIAKKDSPGTLDAATVLGKLGDVAFEELAQGTLSGSAELRANCVYALGIGRDPRAVAVLLPLLGDTESLVRAWTATALGEIGEAAAIGPLAKLLGDADSGVVACAIRALVALGGDEVMAALEVALGDDRKEVRLSAISALEQIGTQAAVGAITAALEDEDAEIAAHAFKALCKAGPGEQGTLAAAKKALVDKDAAVRGDAVRCLFAIHSEAAGKALVGAIDDEAPEVAGLAIEALSRMKYEAAIDPLLDAVLAGDSSLAWVALRAVADIGGPADPKKTVAVLVKVEPGMRAYLHVPLVATGKKAVKPVAKLLGSKDPSLRAEAARILGKIKDPSCKGPLVKALGDVPEVAAAAVTGLGSLGDESVAGNVLDIIVHEDEGVRAAVCKVLGKLGGKAAIEALLVALSDSSFVVRSAAAEALGLRIGPGVTEALIAALGDSSIEVRSSAAKALGHGTGPVVVEALVNALGSPEIDVRVAAAEALGEIGDAASVEPLIALLAEGAGSGSKSGGLRIVAVRALGKIGDARALPALAPLLEDEDDGLVANVAAALGEIGDKEATPALMAALKAHAAGFYCMDGFDSLTGVGFGSCTHWTTVSILAALAKIGDASALDLVMGFIQDPDPEARKAAAELIVKVGGPWHLKKIEGLLDDVGTGK